MIVLAIACLGHARLHGTDRLDVVILVDLSQSVAAEGQNNTTKFQKNVRGVTHVIDSLPAGSRVSVYGITDDSFGKPYPLLTANLSYDEGSFKERLAQGHRQLVRAWQERASKLKPQFLQTDILGAILTATQVFEQSPNACLKMLVIFSDMRQSTRTLDLEHRGGVEPQAADSLIWRGLQPDLRGVNVYVLGADSNGLTVLYWQDLRLFWISYLQHLGATVKEYSMLRPIPVMGK